MRFFDYHALGEPADQHPAAAGAEVNGSVERTGHLGSADVKDFAEVARHRTVVRIGRHHVTHVPPPPSADVSGGDGIPLALALDFNVAEEIVGLGVEEDRVAAHSVVQQDRFELGPDRTVPPLVLRLGSRLDRHSKSFANHLSILRENCPPYQRAGRHGRRFGWANMKSAGAPPCFVPG